MAALALTGCSYSIQGNALPESGFVPSGTSAAPTSSSTGATAPKIAKQRTVAGVDPCTMLDENDFSAIGPFTKPPAREDDMIQESCQYILGDGSPAGRSVVTALYQRYEHVRDRQDKGSEKIYDGHSGWVLCNLIDNVQVCTVTVAVNTNRSILVAMNQPGGETDRMLAVMEPLVKAALGRIPPA